jgi:hypothetical protein
VKFEVKTSEYFEQFVRERQYIQNVTPATMDWYRTAWKKFGPYLKDATNEGELRMKIKEAMVAVGESRTLSPESVNTYFRVCPRRPLPEAEPLVPVSAPTPTPKLNVYVRLSSHLVT